MSAFTALNIIPDEDSDDDVDNTKEIQIEEALKLYQTALKLHSQCPATINETHLAYQALFQSEIFTYPESQPLLEQKDVPSLNIKYHEEVEDDDLMAVGPRRSTAGRTSRTDGVPSTLPQILHLAFKNRGAFQLDYLEFHMKQWMEEAAAEGVDRPIPRDQMLEAVVEALSFFTEALARDDTDSELWRRTSRIVATLGSKSLLRFCLEAVVAHDDGNADGGLSTLRLEEAIAGEELKELLHKFEDSISLTQPNMVQLQHKRLAPVLRKEIDPYPYLPHIFEGRGSDLIESTPVELAPERLKVLVPEQTWTAIGGALVEIITTQLLGLMEMTPGAGVLLENPDAYWEGLPVAEVEMSPQISHDAEAPVNGHLAIEDAPKIDEESQPSNDNVRQPEGDSPSNQTLPAEVEPQQQQDTNQQTRPAKKRTRSAMESPEGSDGGVKRSKRLRERDSLAADVAAKEETAAHEMTKAIDEHLALCTEADAAISEVIRQAMEPLGLDAVGSLDELHQQALDGSGNMHRAIADLHALLQSVVDETIAPELYDSLVGYGFIHTAAATEDTTRDAGLRSFLEHARGGSHKTEKSKVLDESIGVEKFAKDINRRWLHVQEAAFEWLQSLLITSQDLFVNLSGSSYLQTTWPHVLRKRIDNLLIILDEYIYDRFREHRDSPQSLGMLQEGDALPSVTASFEREMLDMAQTILELQLDIYDRAIDIRSVDVDHEMRAKQQYRLERWSTLVSDLFSARKADLGEHEDLSDPLSLRFIWASTMFAAKADGVSREHVLLMLNDLRMVLQQAGNPVIKLPNNLMMPEISVAAAEKEISRLKTKDFFIGIFQSDQMADPVDVIEALEPVLDPQANKRLDGTDDPVLIADDQPARTDSAHLQEMAEYLETASVSLKILLWKRLRDAYVAIEYPPKVMSCYLRSLEIIIDGMDNAAYQSLPLDDRQAFLSEWVATTHDLVIRALTLALNDATTFDCVDEEHLKTSISAVGKLCRLLHTFAVFDDTIRSEKRYLEAQEAEMEDDDDDEGGNESVDASKFGKAATKFQDAQIRAWTLLYTMIKEAMKQHPDRFPNLVADRLSFLQALHHAAGLRGFCGASNHILLKVCRLEILATGVSAEYEDDLIQVLYDLYGLRLSGARDTGVERHRSKRDVLTKAATIQIMDFVMRRINRVKLKDFHKTDYKAALDKMQKTIPTPESSNVTKLNTLNINTFLKSPINPQHLYRSLRGVFELSTIPADAEVSRVADKGWYLMLGHLALMRFRSKRTAPGPTDDLDLAYKYLKQDLMYGKDRWETWYRQATVFDCRVEEDSQWTAEKLNNDRPGLNVLQRQAIHCYIMAVSCAARLTDPTPDERANLSDLYSDFGTRIYSSSRPPYSMTAFWLDDFERHYSGAQEMYKKSPYPELTEYKAWGFARNMFQKALVEKPDLWTNYYMLGKCLWKMFNHANNAEEEGRPALVEAEDVIYAFTRAIETIPPRSSRSDKPPLFEPHYKLISVVHKMVRRNVLEPERGSEILKATRYAWDGPPATDREQWEPYILKSLKNIRKADKLNWHHRMTVRAAHVIYDEASNDVAAAAAARLELNQQIFTKTMEVKVWKPDFERAGRHFVYTSRYVSFFTHLLLQLNDRASMKALTPRVRKKANDFYDHLRIWTRVCVSYITLLRRAGNLPVDHDERVFKSLNHEEYLKNRRRLEKWCTEPESVDHRLLGIVRDAVELQKLDGHMLSKRTADIDDLVVDSYARLYETVIPTLPAEPEPEPEPAPVNGLGEKGPDGGDQKMQIDSLLATAASGNTSDAPRPVPVAAPKSRAKGVSRKEALRDAELIASKSPPSSTPAASTNGSSKAQKTNATQPHHQSSRRSRRGEEADPDQPKEEEEEEEEEQEENEDQTMVSPADGLSSPLSLHDSIDNMSGEENEEEAKPMFPNLARSASLPTAEDEDGSEEEAEGNDGDDENDENEDMGDDDGGDDEEEEEQQTQEEEQETKMDEVRNGDEKEEENDIS